MRHKSAHSWISSPTPAKSSSVGVGRVKLALEAIAKRLAHLGVDTVMVGQITEPAICEKDFCSSSAPVQAKPDSRCSSPAKPNLSVPKWHVSASSKTAR